jgi:hypothetical protein
LIEVMHRKEPLFAAVSTERLAGGNGPDQTATQSRSFAAQHPARLNNLSSPRPDNGEDNILKTIGLPLWHPLDV